MGPATALAAYGGRLIVAGDFSEAGGVEAEHIAAWDPVAESWSPLGGGIVGYGEDLVEELAVMNGHLVVGGRLMTVASAEPASLVYWDGYAWHAVESGPDGKVSGLAVHQDALYLGGEFQEAGGWPSHYIARWSGIGAMGAPWSAEPGAGIELEPAWPNPFGSHTGMRFTLPAAGRVELGVYDLLGRRVRNLGRGTYTAGTHTVSWDGRSRSGQPVSSGVYYLRLETPGAQRTERVIAVR